jgi:hypothetical protein
MFFLVWKKNRWGMLISGCLDWGEGIALCGFNTYLCVCFCGIFREIND